MSDAVTDPSSPEHPDHWIHLRLRAIEKALHALLEIAQYQPDLNQYDSGRLLEAADELRAGFPPEKGS